MVVRDGTNTTLTASEVASLLRVHINTVRRWSNHGLMPTYRIGSRHDRRFNREDVAHFLSEFNKKHNIPNSGAELKLGC